MHDVWIAMLAVGAIGFVAAVLNLRSPNRTPGYDGNWAALLAVSLALVAFGAYQLFHA